MILRSNRNLPTLQLCTVKATIYWEHEHRGHQHGLYTSMAVCSILHWLSGLSRRIQCNVWTFDYLVHLWQNEHDIFLANTNTRSVSSDKMYYEYHEARISASRHTSMSSFVSNAKISLADGNCHLQRPRRLSIRRQNGLPARSDLGFPTVAPAKSASPSGGLKLCGSYTDSSVLPSTHATCSHWSALLPVWRSSSPLNCATAPLEWPRSRALISAGAWSLQLPHTRFLRRMALVQIL